MLTTQQIAANHQTIQDTFATGAAFEWHGDMIAIAHLSETQKNVLDVRNFKAEWAAIRKLPGYTKITESHYASLLAEIRSAYKAAKAKDLAANEFAIAAHKEAGLTAPSHALCAIAKSE